MKGYKFSQHPAYHAYDIDRSAFTSCSPDDIYRYASSVRDIYVKSLSLTRKVSEDGFALPIEDWNQLHGLPQMLGMLIALSNELLLKSIILATTGERVAGHDLRKLIKILDYRYQKIIESYLVNGGAKKERIQNIIKSTARVFEDARYGYEPRKKYRLDFIGLQLLNESLDEIVHNHLPDWMKIKHIIEKRTQKVKLEIREEIDRVFDPAKIEKDKEEQKEWESVEAQYKQSKL